jgi:hypothetical protein
MKTPIDTGKTDHLSGSYGGGGKYTPYQIVKNPVFIGTFPLLPLRVGWW